MSKISEESVRKSLRNVTDPDLHKDLVTLDMVKEIKINGKNISVNIEWAVHNLEDNLWNK